MRGACPPAGTLTVNYYLNEQEINFYFVKPLNIWDPFVTIANIIMTNKLRETETTTTKTN